MVKILLEAGSDINYQDSRGWTPLMIAAAQGFEDMVEFLLQWNARVDLKDKYGKKVADKAKTQSIFYMVSSAAIDQRMLQSNAEMAKITPEKPLDFYNADNYKTEPDRFKGCSSIKKVK